MTTVLITGANRGLGLEFAKQYKADHAEVIACCRNPENALALKALGVTTMSLDISSSDSISRLAEALHAKPIDILINNAGVYGPDRQSADDCDFDGLLETVHINALAPLMLAATLKANLLAGAEKKLAFLTSKMGSISDSSGGFLAYRASKAALNMIADSISKEWRRDGIAVALLHPGWVQTDMGGTSAPIKPEDSVKGLRARIAELSLKTSGRFVDFQGREIGW
jgi:NAD(P)-dependent dehydrogenase (short-subunit alcohol dehydrogenase family)